MTTNTAPGQQNGVKPRRRRRTGVTQARVRAALAQLGMDATLVQIRDALGGGSMRDIFEVTRQVRAGIPPIGDPGAEALGAMTGMLLQQLEAYTDEMRALRSDQAELSRHVTRRLAAIEGRLPQLGERVGQAKGKTQRDDQGHRTAPHEAQTAKHVLAQLDNAVTRITQHAHDAESRLRARMDRLGSDLDGLSAEVIRQQNVLGQELAEVQRPMSALQQRVDAEATAAAQSIGEVLRLQHQDRAEQEAWSEEILVTLHRYGGEARSEASDTAAALAKAITFGLNTLVALRAEQEAWSEHILRAIHERA